MWWWRQRLEWQIYKPRNTGDADYHQRGGRIRMDYLSEFPKGTKHICLHLDFGLQNCKRINFYPFKLLILCYTFKATLGKEYITICPSTGHKHNLVKFFATLLQGWSLSQSAGMCPSFLRPQQNGLYHSHFYQHSESQMCCSLLPWWLLIASSQDRRGKSHVLTWWKAEGWRAWGYSF